jgi:glutamine amidotransferase
MRTLDELGLTPVLKEAGESGKPFLGICLGMQLLYREQEEGATEGLGLLPGRVRKLAPGVKVPHIGWNRSQVTQDGPLGRAGEECYYYFVHSFVAEPEDPADAAAVTEYGEVFPSVVVRGNVWGTQFHPELSSRDGLALVQAFVDAAGGARRSGTAAAVTEPAVEVGAA